MKKCFDTTTDENLALLQTISIPIEPWLPSSALLLLNRPISSVMSKISRMPVNFDYDKDHYDALVERQGKASKNNDILRDFSSIPIGVAPVDQQEDGGPCPWNSS